MWNFVLVVKHTTVILFFKRLQRDMSTEIIGYFHPLYPPFDSVYQTEDTLPSDDTFSSGILKIDSTVFMSYT